MSKANNHPPRKNTIKKDKLNLCVSTDDTRLIEQAVAHVGAENKSEYCIEAIREKARRDTAKWVYVPRPMSYYDNIAKEEGWTKEELAKNSFGSFLDSKPRGKEIL